jgi:hypothetical protein
MTALDLMGWVGSAILVWSLLQTRILRLRVINLVGSAILIVFNALVGVWPMVGLNVVLVVINLVFLRALLMSRHSATSYTVVQVEPDDAYLGYLIECHAKDIATFNPGFAPGAALSGEAYLILHGEETVGYVLLHDAGSGVAQIDLDYVTPRYRDFTPGEFVFRRSRLLAEKGYTRVVTAPGEPGSYYPSIGFERVAGAYELDLTRSAA